MLCGVESEAFQHKRHSILAATEWVAMGKGKGDGLQMRDLLEKYSVKHSKNVHREAERIERDPGLARWPTLRL